MRGRIARQERTPAVLYDGVHGDPAVVRPQHTAWVLTLGSCAAHLTSLTARSEEEIARKMVGRRHVHLVITAAVGVVNKPADHRGIHAFGVYWTTSISTALVPNKHVSRSIRSMKVPSSSLRHFTRQQAFSTSQTPPCPSPCTASRTSTRYRATRWPGYNESQSTVSLCTTTRSEVLTCRTLLYARCRAA